jgi:hypothetical protein
VKYTDKRIYGKLTCLQVWQGTLCTYNRHQRRLEGGQHRQACIELSRLVLRVEALQGSSVAIIPIENCYCWPL